MTTLFASFGFCSQPFRDEARDYLKEKAAKFSELRGQLRDQVTKLRGADPCSGKRLS